MCTVLLLIANVKAEDLSCPPNSFGTHPKCLCDDNKPYDTVNRICATTINVDFLLAKCPKGSDPSSEFPACICPQGKVYVADRDECVLVDRSQCPKGSKRVNEKCVCERVNDLKYEFDEIFWICRPWYLKLIQKFLCVTHVLCIYLCLRVIKFRYIPVPTTTTTTERIYTPPPPVRPTCGAHQNGTSSLLFVKFHK